MQPFWPRHSPHFLVCRHAVRACEGPAVIGLSGGPDSLALVAAAAAEHKDVRAVVIDHGLQTGSSEVAHRAASQASAWGIEATVVQVEVNGSNLEAAAREARYDALLSFGVDVWVAHTADDQAETFLLGALRGNPSGMPPRTDRGVVRPLLGVRRADTVGACQELGVVPWSDPMNEDTAYRRVAIRRTLIPQLSELIGGDCIPALATTADRIAADNGFIDSVVDTSASADCAELAGLPTPVRRRKLVAWLHEQGVRIDGSQLAEIDHLVTQWHGQGAIDVGEGRVVRRVSGILTVTFRSGKSQ